MSKKILIVDDSSSVREMVRFTLEPLGFDVVEAENGRSALAAFKRDKFRMVISDLNMPVMNGIEFVRGARSSPGGMGVPIVMLTTESKPEAKAAGKAAGATGWMNKPFDAQQLKAIVTKLTG